MKKSSNARRRESRARRVDHAEEMARDERAERVVAMPLTHYLNGVFHRQLEIITESHKSLINAIAAGISRGVTADEYRVLADQCFVMICDVNDYARAVTRQELDAVRSHHAQALYHSDARPMSSAASAAAGTRRQPTVYGESVGDSSGRSALFDLGGDDDLMLPPVTPYETPATSAATSTATTPSSSRPASPTAADFDLMGS